MTTLFDQETVMRNYYSEAGREGKEEGREEERKRRARGRASAQCPFFANI